MKRLIILLVLGAIAGFGWYVLSRGFSARTEPSAIEISVARRLRGLATPRGSREAQNPVAANPAVLSEAMAHFAEHCAVCHANDGSGDTDFGRGMYPKPPDMRESDTQSLSDGELYYIIHNGVRFTGMPAFGAESLGANDEDSWKLVHFIRHLPQITAEEVEQMKSMNPKTPGELQQEEAIRKFLEGGDAPPPNAGHHH